MNLGNLVKIVVYYLLIEMMTCLDHRDDFPMMSALVFMMHTRDGNGTGHFEYPPRPAPPLMGRDIIFLNRYGTGLRFFFKPRAGSGRVRVLLRPASPHLAPIIYKIKIKFNLKFKIILI